MGNKALKASLAVYGFTRAALFIAYKVLFLFQHYGSGNVPQEADRRGVILAPNHASFLDPPILGISLKRRVTYLAKDYLFRNFFVGWLLRSIGALPIKTQGEDFRSLRALLSLLKEGECVVVFPEGTRSLDGRFREPESGVGFLAAKSEAYVVPVYIQGTFKAFPKGAKWFRCCPVRAHFGQPFIPFREKESMTAESPYLAISRKIMAEIKKIKELVEGPE